MTFKQADLDYFRRGLRENPRFWARFGGPPSFAGLQVADVGCGLGSMCIDIAQAGASKVVGLDLAPKAIAFANAYLQQNHPDLQGVVSFVEQDLKDYPPETFDIIVSKDSFEHILDLPAMLSEMHKRLRPGGRVYAGFGPLYNSPFGDHGHAQSRVPWMHLLIGRERMLARVRRRWPKGEFRSLHDIGLNGLAFADYCRIFAASGFNIVYFRPNASTKAISMIFSVFRRLPPLQEYFTHNIYCILEKPRI